MGDSTVKEGDDRGPKTSIQPEAVPTGPPDAPISQEGDLAGRADATGKLHSESAFVDKRRHHLQDRIVAIEERLQEPDKSEVASRPWLYLGVGLAAIAVIAALVYAISDSLSFFLPLFGLGVILLPIVQNNSDEKKARLRQDLKDLNRELEDLERSVKDPVDRLVSINISNLEKYYGLVERHTNRSFVFSVTAGGLGFLLLIVGLTIGFNSSGSTSAAITAYITSGAGILVQFISAVFFYLYRKTVGELRTYHERLLRVQNTLLAFRYIEGIEDAATKAQTLSELIAALVAREAILSTDGDTTPETRETSKPRMVDVRDIETAIAGVRS